MYAITLVDIAVAFIPVLVTLVIIFFWSSSLRTATIAILRMLIQLLLIGYALEFIFNANNQWIIIAVLSFMLIAASWIALGALPVKRSTLLSLSLIAIAGGGIFNLVLITQGVLHVDPWYQPAVLIPLAGMIFSNAMNSVSLAGERLYSELEHHNDYARARNTAFQAAMIPITNSLLAVGLVSLPGMMTGQILAGASPLIAARYQIIVMCMIFSSAGISAALFLWLLHSQRHQPSGASGTD
ncbi:MAG: ABC transporter permease [Gammaproteobacteria bacterium]|nr:MAG: ABC transporter permease [Gammaproteobacteria bacterium]